MSEKSKIKSQFLLKSFFVLIISALAIQSLAVWTDATNNPPDGDIPLPVNVGSDAQQKIGPLLAQGFRSTSVGIFDGSVSIAGFLGVGIEDPAVALDIAGQFRLADGTEGSGKVLTSSADGTASWDSIAGLQTPWAGNVNADGHILFGNDTSGGDLFLESTSHATKGDIILNQTSGNVGIGTNNPLALLHVNGDTRIDGLIFLGAQPGLAGQVLTSNGASAPTWQDPTGGGSALSALTPATATNTINNANYRQEWKWDTLGDNQGLVISSNTTQIPTNGDQHLIEVNLSGAHANSAVQTIGINVQNSHSGANSNNMGGYFSAINGANNYAGYFTSSGGSNNWAGYFSSSGANSLNIGAQFNASGGTNNYGVIVANGNVGIGDTSPLDLLTVGSGDKFRVNSTGNLVRVNNVIYSWPSAQGAAGTTLSNDGAGNLTWVASSAGPWTKSSTNVYLTTAGDKVGIGTQTPGKNLEVAGSDIIVNSLTVGRGNGNISSNVAFGSSALISNSSGVANTAIGYNSNYYVSTGSGNTGIGASSLGTGIGANNTAVGYEAMSGTTTYSTNTAIGYRAMYSVGSSANQNTALGANSGMNPTNLTNSTAIGYGATATTSNQVRIGNSSVTSLFFGTAQANLNVGTGQTLQYTTTGEIVRATSSKRYKKDIVDLDIDTSKIYDLRPVSFNLIRDNSRHFGLIAEEVADIIPDLAYYVPEKDVVPGSTSTKMIPDSVDYPLLSVLLLKETKKHEAIIKSQQKQIDDLKAEIEMLKIK